MKSSVLTRGVYLIGFSGSGKTTIGKRVGRALGWQSYDVDELIVERSGMEIPVIFQREGEPGFRVRESEALRASSGEQHFVIATGAGAVVLPANLQFMRSRGWIICLDAQPQTVLSRIQQQISRADANAIRPMLDAVYPLEQIRALKHARQSAYGLADWTIHTDRLSEEQVASEVLRALELLEHSSEPAAAEDNLAGQMRHTLSPDLPPPITVVAGPWPYQVVVGWEHLSAIGERVRKLLPQASRAAVLIDANLTNTIGWDVTESLAATGLQVHARAMQCDESVKTAAEVGAIHDWLVGIQLQREDVFLTVGGGAMDDVGGFAASTYMRGIALVKVPTSLDGMVDSAIGGKTALNHPSAPNLIGTFYHPRLIWADASLLRSEPRECLSASWAEVVKYSMIENSLLRTEVAGASLFDQLYKDLDKLLALEKRTLLATIARCVALKAQVVSGDERDFGQYRILLNYGHTVGHALEAVTNFRLLHGEAVAIGMVVEATLAVNLGMAPQHVADAQRDLLARFGLPTRVPDVSLDALLDLIRSDKKSIGGKQRWVLPVALGSAAVSRNVTENDLVAAVRQNSAV